MFVIVAFQSSVKGSCVILGRRRCVGGSHVVASPRTHQSPVEDFCSCVENRYRWRTIRTNFGRAPSKGSAISSSTSGRASSRESAKVVDPGRALGCRQCREPHLPVEPRLMRHRPTGPNSHVAGLEPEGVGHPGGAVHGPLDDEFVPARRHDGEQTVRVRQAQWRRRLGEDGYRRW